MAFEADPTLDLVLERTVDVPPSFVWDAWTQPELLKRWFCPAPWRTVEAEVDLRPGGIFRTVMRSPEGQDFPNVGCFLEVVRGSRLVWTGALGPDYRPQSIGPLVPFVMTAIITIEPTADGGTRYTATVLHADASGREKHEAMGFHHGWNAAFDQLVAMAPAR
jgi:uncharacterized protein YndB with AHSA1/START domain